MGAVAIDVNKRERSFEEKYPLYNEMGVEAFLENVHQIRSMRLNGDIDASTLLLDFWQAYEITEITDKERLALYWRYERDYTLNEASKVLGITLQAVDQRCERAISKITETFKRIVEREGHIWKIA